MARIPREEHARIRERVDLGQEKVAGVAASYNCTPANIYAILARLRREGTPDSNQPTSEPSLAEPGEPSLAASPAAVDAPSSSMPPTEGELPLFGTLPDLEPRPSVPLSIAATQAVIPPTHPEVVPAAASSPSALKTQSEAPSAELIAAAPHPVRPTPAELEVPPPPAAKPGRPSGPPANRLSVGGAEAKLPLSKSKAGKTGIALMMRTSDGEEAVHPFRSIEELLSAAKPILRTAAKSPEPIWFSIQTVDLDTLEDAF